MSEDASQIGLLRAILRLERARRVLGVAALAPEHLKWFSPVSARPEWTTPEAILRTYNAYYDLPQPGIFHELARPHVLVEARTIIWRLPYDGSMVVGYGANGWCIVLEPTRQRAGFDQWRSRDLYLLHVLAGVPLSPAPIHSVAEAVANHLREQGLTPAEVTSMMKPFGFTPSWRDTTKAEKAKPDPTIL